MSKRHVPLRLLNLALQGGGAHGAFTCGVLDQLLEDGRTRFEGISDTSAGAMNVAALAHGRLEDGAREALSRIWLSVAPSSRLQLAGAIDGIGNGSLVAPMRAMPEWTSFLGPEHLNPLDINPLQDIVTAQIDSDRSFRCSPVKLFLAATHANTGKLRLFQTEEISVDTVLASACLSSLQRAVEIDGEPYWDGGYAANPIVFPLFYECSVPGILQVLLAPVNHGQTPSTVQEIKRQVANLAFNSDFLREMRTFAQLMKAIRHSPAKPGQFETRLLHTRFHLINAEGFLSELSADSRLATYRSFLETFEDLGRSLAKEWLKRNHTHVGHRSAVDLAHMFY